MDLGASVILWRELWSFLGMVINQNYVELHMPQNKKEFEFPGHLKK
jgi:hypothetical protein